MNATENLGEAKKTTRSAAQVDTLTLGNDVNNHEKRPESITGENKSKQPLIARSVISKSDSRRGKPSEEQNRVANVNTPSPIPADGSEDVRNRELPSMAASTAKPQPAVSHIATPRNGPPPLTPQLISPSKSSPPKGRTIQWP